MGIRKENFVQINRADSNLFYTGKSDIDLNSPVRSRMGTESPSRLRDSI
jgi:hypothetical protein